jgi:hypothetical protein
MRKLSEDQWQSLANALVREMAHVAPDWAAHNTHDPGITVLELLSFALTDLQHHQYKLDPHGRLLALQIAQLAQSLSGKGSAGDCPPGLQRLNYFTGQLLGVHDFAAEQDYIRNKMHRRNRLLHGAGVVSGLQVTLERAVGKTQAVIAPGLAFNARGEEIEVCAPTTLPLPAQGKSLLVLLHYAEQPCQPVPAPATDAQSNAQEQTRFSRITETFSAMLAPSADDTAVALARLNFTRGRWTLDRKFRVAMQPLSP